MQAKVHPSFLLLGKCPCCLHLLRKNEWPGVLLRQPWCHLQTSYSYSGAILALENCFCIEHTGWVIPQFWSKVFSISSQFLARLNTRVAAAVLIHFLWVWVFAITDASHSFHGHTFRAYVTGFSPCSVVVQPNLKPSSCWTVHSCMQAALKQVSCPGPRHLIHIWSHPYGDCVRLTCTWIRHC